MTAREVLDSFRAEVPSQAADDTLVSWISEIEGTLIEEIVLTHEGAPEGAASFGGITLCGGMDDKLTAAAPYSKLYLDYLKMKSDLANSDSIRYADSSAVFSASYADFADWYNRHFAPKGVGALKTR